MEIQARDLDHLSYPPFLALQTSLSEDSSNLPSNKSHGTIPKNINLSTKKLLKKCGYLPEPRLRSHTVLEASTQFYPELSPRKIPYPVKNESANRAQPKHAMDISKIVKKKAVLLSLKHHLKPSSRLTLPNLCEIEESVREQKPTFIRRMDKELNKKNGHANLLGLLNRTFRNTNYLEEFRSRLRLNRTRLLSERIQNIGES